MFFNISNVFAEHMNLFGIDAVGFQFIFNGFKIVEIVTDVIVPIHATPPIPCLLETSSVRQPMTRGERCTLHAICKKYSTPWRTG
ncbi:hypothetical protein D9M71_173850 [compost metagenome]